jgi:hypothetical protein
MSTSTAPSYSAWKRKTVEAKPVNIASFTDFPDLSEAPLKKKDVFAGISLADRLKETIAEEEAAQIRRMKREEKEEAWLRANCVALPLKGYTGRTNPPPVEGEEDTRSWMHELDAEPVIVMPPFRPASLLQQQQLNKLKKLQRQVEEDNYRWQVTSNFEEEMDRASLPSLPEDEETYAEGNDEDCSSFDNHE